ncbi:MAG: ribosome maturation factor RimP [Rhodothermales bacterium]|jgi:ribosome maturation factor RimP
MALATEDRIRNIVDTVVPGDEVYIVDIEIKGSAGTRLVEVFLDSDNGVKVGELARISREVGFLMESEEIMSGPYRLDVSSPGAERPLRLMRQYAKHIGRTLAVKMQGGEEVRGLLSRAEDGVVTLEVDKAETALAFDRIQEAKVVLPW